MIYFLPLYLLHCLLPRLSFSRYVLSFNAPLRCVVPVLQ
jgi:hypothetical protein